MQATLQRLSQNMDLQQLLQMATGRGLPEPPAVSGLPGTGHFWRLVADQGVLWCGQGKQGGPVKSRACCWVAGSGCCMVL